MDLRSLSWILPVILVCNFGRFEAQLRVPPSRGDLIIVSSDNLLIISMAPDGIRNATKYFYYVSGEYPGLPDTVGGVVARQLGYSFCMVTYPEADTNLDIQCLGMGGFKCQTGTSHILRCSYNSTPGVCKVLVQVDCSNDYSYRMGIIDGVTLGNLGYHGQVLLYPPANFNGLIQQASVGIVMVKEEHKGQQYWRHVHKGNRSVDEAVAGTFCRQMGYTHVNPSSIMTRSEAEYLYGYDFTAWDPFSPSKIDVTEVDCHVSSQRCLGCCHYPPPSDSYFSTDIYPDALVIRCTFGSFSGKPPIGGSEDVCALNDFKLKSRSICDMDEKISLEERAFIAAVVVPPGVLLLLCCALMVCLIFVCLKWKGRCWHNVPARELGGEDEYQHVPDEPPDA